MGPVSRGVALRGAAAQPESPEGAASWRAHDALVLCLRHRGYRD